MTKEEVLVAFEADIRRMDIRQGELTTEDIKKTANTLISKDRTGVIEALRYWLQLRESGPTVTACIVIADINIPELKPDLECLKAEIESGKTFHPSYLYWVDSALKNINEKPKR